MVRESQLDAHRAIGDILVLYPDIGAVGKDHLSCTWGDRVAIAVLPVENRVSIDRVRSVNGVSVPHIWVLSHYIDSISEYCVVDENVVHGILEYDTISVVKKDIVNYRIIVTIGYMDAISSIGNSEARYIDPIRANMNCNPRCSSTINYCGFFIFPG